MIPRPVWAKLVIDGIDCNAHKWIQYAGSLKWGNFSACFPQSNFPESTITPAITWPWPPERLAEKYDTLSSYNWYIYQSTSLPMIFRSVLMPLAWLYIINSTGSLRSVQQYQHLVKEFLALAKRMLYYSQTSLLCLMSRHRYPPAKIRIHLQVQ